MEKILISVIVPVYNVEKYLEKCVNSILNQTYKNLEIILIDDGSPDGCPEMCDNLAKTDGRIKVIHKQNGGLSDARNVGIENATGKLISFVDSDDFLNTNYFETLYKNLTKTNSDISICSFVSVQENEIVDTTEFNSCEVLTFTGMQKLEQLYSKDHHVEFVTAWGKLYKTSLFETIKYPKGKINEDEFVCHKLLDSASKVCYQPVKYYYYLQRENSIMHQHYTKKNLAVFDAYTDRFLLFKQKDTNLATNALYEYLSTIISRYYKFDKGERQTLLKIYNEYYGKEKKYIKSLSKKRKLKLFLFKYFRIFYKFYNK